jgi:hypothetical protein
MPWFAAGCVVPEPEKFREPERSPPILNLDQAVPSINQLIAVRTDVQQSFTFTIPVRSEDSGDNLAGVMNVNYKTPTETFFGYQTLPASTLDDTNRKFSFSSFFNLRCDNGNGGDEPGCCARLTLVVTHESNISTEGGLIQPDPVLSKGDLAIATWWLAVDAPEGNPSRIDDCPLLGGNP